MHDNDNGTTRYGAPQAPTDDSLGMTPIACGEFDAPMWSRLLRAARAARTVNAATSFGAPSAASRAFALELTDADNETRRLGLHLCASLCARGLISASVAEVRRVWDDIEEMRAPTPALRPHRQTARSVLASARRLPVERARVVPITEVLTSLGVRARRVSPTCLIARCPLGTHRDRTPSFTANPSKGVWYCHGCHEGGDGIALVERVRGVDFATAVCTLAA